MFRRKRFSEPAASMPWWPSEDPDRSPGYPGVRGGPGGFGPAPAPPLAAHDPFGGWPAFGDGYSDDGADGGHGMPAHGHPANGWPLAEGWSEGAEPADPFGVAAAFHPATHPNGDPVGHPDRRPINGHLTGHPSTGRPVTGHPDRRPINGHLTGHPVTGHPSTGRPVTGHPSTGNPSTGHPPSDAPSSGDPTSGDTPGEGLPDWLPLLTHPIGGQRFQPGLEAAPDPTECPTPGRQPRRRGGRRPSARRRQGAPVDGSEADPTTWIQIGRASWRERG